MDSKANPADEALFEAVLKDLLDAQARGGDLLQFGHVVSAHQYLPLYRLMARHVARGSRVLDWGAGNGHFSYFLLRAGYQAAGFDFGPLPALLNAARGAYDYRVADPAQPSALPFEDASFDAVAGVGVLEHVRETGGNEAASLAEAARLLKPGGTFLCFHLPNQFSWIEAGLRLAGRWSHHYRFTAEQVRALAAGAGLHIREMGRYALLPRNIWWWGPLRRARHSQRAARLYDAADQTLARVASPFCQCYYFVAVKSETE